jgi:hypothetical protein
VLPHLRQRCKQIQNGGRLLQSLAQKGLVNDIRNHSGQVLQE